MRATAAAPPQLGEVSWGIAPATCRAPRPHASVIPREQLVGDLGSARCPIVVVRAPAGYGKTTALSLWDRADPRPFAWVHLDDLDNDPVHLLRHVALALDVVRPLGDQLVHVLAGAGRSPELDLLPAVLDALAEQDAVVLVLDETETMHSDDAINCLDLLLGAMPDGSQVALAGRAVPTHLLARRRLAGDLHELGPGRLAMSLREASELFANAGVDLDEVMVEELVSSTEGWVAGLRMAEMALSDPGRRRSVMLEWPHQPLIADYLAAEVLDRLPDADLHFLLRAAVIDPLDAKLLDEVLETHGSATRLEALEHDNAFITRQDDAGCFHLHVLLRDVLLDRLRAEAPDVESDLLRRWTEALDARGEPDRAIRAAIAAGDHGRAAEIVQRHTVDLVLTGRVQRLGQWLELLGDDVLQRSAPAAVSGAWHALTIGDRHLLTEMLSRAGRSEWVGPLPDGTPSIEVSLAVVRAMESKDGIDAAIESCEVARAGGDPATNPLWGLATLLRGAARLMRGDVELARHDLLSCRDARRFAPVYECNVLAYLAYLDLQAGDLAGADRHGCDALRLADRHSLDGFALAMPVYAIGALVSARSGRLEQAGRALTTARDLVTRIGDLSARATLHGWLLLAETALVLGRRAEARTYATEAQRSRRRDPAASGLCERLDEVFQRLANGDGVCEVDPLTPAELRLLRYLPTHYSLQEIADLAYISRNTAKSHAIAIYRKLGATTRSEAVEQARRLGLLPAPMTDPAT